VPVDWGTAAAPADPSSLSYQLSLGLAGNRGGDPRGLHYEEVLCPGGRLGQRCYRLCVRGECQIWPDDSAHSRVQTFIEAVKAIGSETGKARNADVARITFSLTTLSTCGGAILTAALVDPEPGTKTVLALVGLLSLLSGCGGSLAGLDDAQHDRSTSTKALGNAQLNAEAQFLLLQLQDQP
jgi:hypothetical protein